MKKQIKCLQCAHNYRGDSAPIECLAGCDPDDCRKFKQQTHCCFDCREYQVVDKSCNLHNEVPGAFVRHACKDFEPEVATK